MTTDMHSKASTVFWIRRAKAGLIDDDSVSEARQNFNSLATIMQETEL
jgi:hypothetical protein